MTRGEVAIAHSFNRTLYYGTAPVVVVQMPDIFSKSDVCIVRAAHSEKGRWWRTNFDELTAIPEKAEVA